MKIPKKYQAAIKEIYTDEDGIWCNLNPNWGCGVFHEDGVMHCETWAELREEMTYIRYNPDETHSKE
jgi:hypothetical protein